MEVKLSTRGRKGKITKSVEVFSSDPKTPKLILKVSALAEPIAVFEPRFVNLGKVRQGKTGTATVKIVGRDAGKMRIEEISVRDPRVLKVEGGTGEGPPVLQVTFLAGEKIRSFSEKVTVTTNIVTPETLEFFVSGQVTGNLVTDRDYVIFEPFGKQHNDVREVQVSSLSGETFRITAVEDPSGTVSGAVSQKENGWSILLRLTGETTAPGGRIRIRTDREDQETLFVSYGIRALPPPKGKSQRPKT